PKGSTLTPPDIASFAQAHHPDAMLAEEQVDEERVWRGQRTD
ncbi:hypothetical protein L915_07916, partial [Phytophthora nicotianae]